MDKVEYYKWKSIKIAVSLLVILGWSMILFLAVACFVELLGGTMATTNAMLKVICMALVVVCLLKRR